MSEGYESIWFGNVMDICKCDYCTNREFTDNIWYIYIYIVIASWPRHQLSHTGSCIGTSLLIAPSRISSKWSHQMISIYYPLRMSAIWNLDEEMHPTSNCYRLETPSSLPWQFDVSWGRLSCTETSRFKLQVKSEETTHGCMNVCLLRLLFK